MDHGVDHLDPGRESVDEQPSRLALKNGAKRLGRSDVAFV